MIGKLSSCFVAIALVAKANIAMAQQGGCEVTIPQAFRLLERAAPGSGGPDYPAQTRVRAITYGTAVQGGRRAVRVQIDTAEGWLFLWPAQLRRCPPGSIAQRPGDVSTGGTSSPVAPMPSARAGSGSLGGLNFTGAPLFGRLMVGPDFITRSVRGRAGGAIGAQGIHGQGTCRGFFVGPPSHVMLLTQPRDFLRMYVMAAADTTLIVRRPDGQVLCNDDTYQSNPAIEGAFPAGLYQVWIGTYRENEASPYALTITADSSQRP